jgi:hypothetical protein
MSAVAKLERWKVVHEALMDVAVRRAALDADEMRWLYEAEQLQIWKQLGVVSMVDYQERTHRERRKSACGSTLGLEIHHIIARADGGTHDPTN